MDNIQKNYDKWLKIIEENERDEQKNKENATDQNATSNQSGKDTVSKD